MTTGVMAQVRSAIWWIFLLKGITGILMGLLLVTAPRETLVAMVTFLGFYWLIDECHDIGYS